MNFSKLKLVTEMLAAGAGTSLTTNANNKASQAAQASKQVSSTTNNVGAQSTQMAAKPTKSNIASPVQQRTQQAASPTATKAGPQTVVSSVDYFDMLRTKKEFVKQLAEKQSDWRSELSEAVGPNDEVQHPYVDIMPHGDAKLKDAQKKAVVAAKKEKDQGTLIGEETIEERVLLQPQGSERKKREKEEKERNARAAKDAVRHARMTKGIPGYDAQGKYHLKDGKKIYEARKDEKGMSADEKSIGRSLLAGLNPLADHMAGPTRQRLGMANRGKKKRKGGK